MERRLTGRTAVLINPRHILKTVQLGLLRATRGLGVWLEPRDPTHLANQLERGEIVWRAFVDAGIALRRCERFADADSMMERGLGAFPDDRTLLYEYAMSAHNSGRYDIAIARWENALRVAPDIAMCSCGLAANLRETRQLDRAQDVVDQALRAFPEDLVVVSEAARVADARGMDEDALALWATAAASCHPTPDWLQGQAQALIRLGRLHEAAVVLTSARDRFPGAQGLMAVEGELASARSDWPAAVAIWGAYRLRFPDDLIGREQFDRAVRASDAQASVSGRNAGGQPQQSLSGDELRQLLLRFESIGDNPEFGTVQRRFAAEPIGLLRWSTMLIDKLIPALEQRFAGLGEGDNTELTLQPAGDFVVRDRRWGLTMHVQSPPEPTDRDALFARTCRRLLMLREKMIADLQAAEKLFVYRSEGLEGDKLEALHRSLRAFGPVRLLNIQPAAPTAPTFFQGRAGELQKVADRRYVGFLERLGVEERGVWDIAFDDWIAVCRKAVAAT